MTTGEPIVVDDRCAAAVDEARTALVDEVPEIQIGAHLEVIADADRVVTHLFECLDPAYVGWRWAVTVARADDSDYVTTDEIVLLPGPGSLLAPDWLPWEDRVKAGDLGVGDVLPTAPDDSRLVPGYTGADLDDSQDDDLVPVLWELGLGRVRVLSRIGRDEATARWAAGDNGPRSQIAKGSSEQCSTCGFLVVMGGPLGRAFGLCANEFSPSDGHVVALDHGCGAHSEAELEPPPVPILDLVVDDLSPAGFDTEPLTEAELAADEAPASDESAEEAAVVEDSTEDAPAEEPSTDDVTVAAAAIADVKAAQADAEQVDAEQADAAQADAVQADPLVAAEIAAEFGIDESPEAKALQYEIAEQAAKTAPSVIEDPDIQDPEETP